jgi:ABC-type nitrate/sulfonate/bicarbonate transport system substrate-binding protein
LALRGRKARALACAAALWAFCVPFRGEARAGEAVSLGWESPGGGVALAAAVRNGFFGEEGIEVTAVRTGLGEFGEAVASGRIAAGELDGRVLGLFRDGAGVGPSAGLYSGFLEIVGNGNPPGKLRVAAEGPGGGPAVAAARHFRDLGVDPDTAVEWVDVGPGGLLDALADGKADVAVRWELERAAPKGGRGHSAAPSVREGHGIPAGRAGQGAGRGTEGRAAGGGRAGSGPRWADGGPAASGRGSGSGGPGEGGGARTGPEGCPGGDSGTGAGTDCGTGPGGADGSRWKVVYSASASLPAAGGPAAGPHARHTAANHFFVSFVVLGRELYERDPALAAAVTRAWIRGAAWTGENLGEAARIGMEAGVWDGDAAGLERELARYMWMPGVAHAKEHLRSYVREWVRRGLLPSGTDEAGFFGGLFIPALPDLG